MTTCRRMNTATRRGRWGIDFYMRYFTTSFLEGVSPGWSVLYDNDATPLSPGTIVKHIETGNVWVITDEPPEPWNGQHLYLGKWPD